MQLKLQKQKNKTVKGLVSFARVFAICLVFVLAFLSVSFFEKRFNKTPEHGRSVGNLEGEMLSESEAGRVTQFSLKIKKINVSAPVISNVDGKDSEFYDQALKEGVAHYKGTALPASGSNVVIFGHSSNVLGVGKYENVFAKLDLLKNGDVIKISFNNNEYSYDVTDTKIVETGDLSILKPTEREQLTLLTCWPIGTNEQRLAIIAEPVQY